MLRLIGLLFWLDGGVCSQNPSHSFWIAGRPLPLCARDLGLFAGFLLTFGLVHLAGWRAHVRWFWLAGLLPLAADGLNSLAHDLLGAGLYPPTNAIRLATGLLAGACLALTLAPTAYRWAGWAVSVVALPVAVAAALGGAYLAVAVAGTAGVLVLIVQANRLATPSRLVPLALALPELASLAALKHLGLLALR